MTSKILNTPFNFSHAAVISLVVHFVFLSVYSFDIFNKPTFPEKKYKKFRLEIVKRPQVIPEKIKPLKVREPILRKFNKPVLPKPTLVSVSKPIRKFESKPIQFIKPTTAALKNRVVGNIQVRTSTSIQNIKFNNPVDYKLPKLTKTILENSPKIVFPLAGKVETGKTLARGTRLNVFAKLNNVSSKISDSDNPRSVRLASSVHKRFDGNKNQVLIRAGNPNRIGARKPKTLVASRSPANYSFKPQVKNMTASFPEQDPLLKEELNNLWNGYTNKVRQMIAKAKIYPPKAREKGQQGKIHLSFKIITSFLLHFISSQLPAESSSSPALSSSSPAS